MIFIGKNHKGQPISIVSAKSKENANAYWQGKGNMPHSVVEFNLAEDRENEMMGYVTPLLITRTSTFRTNDVHGRDIEVLIVET